MVLVDTLSLMVGGLITFHPVTLTSDLGPILGQAVDGLLVLLVLRCWPFFQTANHGCPCDGHICETNTMDVVCDS